MCVFEGRVGVYMNMINRCNHNCLQPPWQYKVLTLALSELLTKFHFLIFGRPFGLMLNERL